MVRHVYFGMARGNNSGVDRREFVTSAIVGATVGVAGCMGDDGEQDDDDETESGREQVPPIELKVRSSDDNPVNNEEARIIFDTWSQLGLDIELETMAHQSFIEGIYQDHDYEVSVGGWGGSIERLDPFHHLYDTHHSDNTDHGDRNLTHYNNPDYDELAEAMIQELDTETRVDMAFELQEILAEDQPGTPLHDNPLLDVINTETVESVTTAIGDGITSYWNAIECETTHGEFSYGARGTTNTLNPLDVPSATDQHMIDLMHDRPFQFMPDGSIEPSLCESYDPIDDTTVELTLQDGPLYFHDGEEITAEDLAYSYELQAEVATPASNFLEAFESVEVLDDRTVQVNLSEPNAIFMTLGLAFPYVLAKHFWEDVEDPKDQANIDDPVGSGPFEYEEWRPEEQTTVTRFDDHHLSPNVDRVIRVEGSSEAFLRMAEDDELDAVWGDGIGISTLRSAAEADNLELEETPNHGIDTVFYYTQQEPFDDPAFRRGLAHAVPKQDIHDAVFQEFGSILHTPVAPANEQWHNPDVEQFGDDLDAARDELEEAGYSWDDDGMLLMPE